MLTFLVIASGAAGITWELIWQHHATLAFGASLLGTAVTLSCLMGGLGLGAWWIATWSRGNRPFEPLRIYGLCELAVGALGLLVPEALRGFSHIDSVLYQMVPWLGAIVVLFGTMASLLLPSIAMGMTIPALAKAVQSDTRGLQRLYAANTGGAVIGIALCVFVLIPQLGMQRTSLVIFVVNISVGAFALYLSARHKVLAATAPAASLEPQPRLPRSLLGVAFLTGYVTLALEVSWFRSLRAAFYATTETFAVILAAFLLALAMGAAFSHRVISRTRADVAPLLTLAGAAVLCATPFIDSMDHWSSMSGDSIWGFHFRRYGQALSIMGVPVFLLGVIFPELLRRHRSSYEAGVLLSINTTGAVMGSLSAGWVLLPLMGSTHTSWFSGALLCISGVLLAVQRGERFTLALLGLAGVIAAWHWNEGSAQTRVHGFGFRDFGQVLFVAEEPEATVWVTKELRSGAKKLIIDGFEASGEGLISEHYMRWMGHLPALATPGRTRGLVICFGTGQTANAARKHGIRRLDIADISSSVFDAAPLFELNEGVLGDPRVRHYVMDGRALLRRSAAATYDFVTLEPMPPNFAGINNLYSKEFYELIRSRLRATGVVAQWIPFHLMSPTHALASIATFAATFPHSRLWLDPVGGTGIVLGGTVPWTMSKSSIPLDLSSQQIHDGFVLDAAGLRCLTKKVPIITDDNQLLSYGPERFERITLGKRGFTLQYRQSLKLIHSSKKRRPSSFSMRTSAP
jgi:spermidine synthase